MDGGKQIFTNQARRQSGLTIIELIVSLAIFCILVAALLGVFSALTRSVKAAREKTVLANLATTYLEIVRNLPYSDVGTVNGNPPGTLADFTNAISVNIESFSYKIYYEVTYIDDPADGTIGGTPNDPAPADYKQVKMSIQNVQTGAVTDFLTNVAPKGLEGTTNAGALRIKVFNYSGQAVAGANVHIEYPTTSPSIILDRLTDSAGQWVEVGLPQGANSYKISVSKGGYTSDQTYPITAQNPNPVQPHATVLNGTVTSISFSIDTPANLSVKTLNQFCQDISGVNLNIAGARLIGTGPPPVYRFNQDFTSGAGGISLNNIEWDTFTPTMLIGQNWVIRGTSPIQKINVLPGTTQTFNFILANVPQDPGVQPDPPWYYDSWNYRRKITIDHSKISGSQTLADFPVLVSATSNDFRFTGNGGHVGKNDGSDIVFTLADGSTALSYEIESFNPAAGQLIAWVRLPSLPSGADTDIYMYYGNAASSDQQDPHGVWDSHYQAVWHLKNGSVLSAADSTDNAANGTINGPTATTAVIDGAANFSASGDYINFGNTSVNIAGFGVTVEAWVRRSSGNTAVIVDKEKTSGQTGGYSLEVNNSSKPFFRTRSAGSSATATANAAISNNTNAFLSGVFNGSSTLVYINGVQKDSAVSSFSMASTTISLGVGRDVAGSGTAFKGKIDEVRVSDIARSADWLLTEYNNQNSPATFYFIASEEAYAPPSGINNSVLVTVKDAASGAVLEGASLHLHKSGSVPQDYYGVTGGSVWLQSDWTGGGGHDAWTATSTNFYFQADGNIDINTLPSGVRLLNLAGSYQASGVLESSTFDTGTSQTQFTTISWSPASQALGTSLSFQLASSDDPEGPWDYVGPDGTPATYYTNSGTNIAAILNNDRYIRYKVFLATTDPQKTPVLSGVSVNYVSGCFTPGQYWFGGLTQATLGSPYDLTVTIPGYTTVDEPLDVNGNQTYDVLMSP